MNMYINLCVLSQSVVPHSLWPHRLQAARVLCPWDCCCSIAQSCLTLCNPMDCARQASLSLTISPSLPRFMSIASVMPSSHLILWYPLLLLPSIFPSIGDFSMSRLFTSDDYNTGASASISALPIIIQGSFPLRLTGLISLLSNGFSEVFSSTTVQRHQFFGALPSLWPSSHIHMRPLGRPQPWLYRPLSAE